MDVLAQIRVAWLTCRPLTPIDHGNDRFRLPSDRAAADCGVVFNNQPMKLVRLTLTNFQCFGTPAATIDFDDLTFILGPSTDKLTAKPANCIESGRKLSACETACAPVCFGRTGNPPYSVSPYSGRVQERRQWVGECGSREPGRWVAGHASSPRSET